jgi:hypothetical protein
MRGAICIDDGSVAQDHLEVKHIIARQSLFSQCGCRTHSGEVTHILR